MTANLSEIKETTKDFLAKYIRNTEIEDEDDLFASGLVNSLFAMQLVLFIEKEYQIKIANEDLDINNFRTINAIVSLITQKLG